MPQSYRVTTAHLNLRGAPNPDADQLEVLNQGDILSDAGAAPVTLDDGNTWINVRSPQNTVGWVNSKHTEPQMDPGTQRPALDESWMQGDYGSRGGHFQIIREAHWPHYDSEQQYNEVLWSDCGPIAVAHVVNMARWAQRNPETLNSGEAIRACVANGSYRYGDLTVSTPGLGDAVQSLSGVRMIYRTTGDWDPNPSLKWDQALELARTRPIIVNKPGHLAAAVADRSGEPVLWLVQGSIGSNYEGDGGKLTSDNWGEWNRQTLHPEQAIWGTTRDAGVRTALAPAARTAEAAQARQRAYDLSLGQSVSRTTYHRPVTSATRTYRLTSVQFHLRAAPNPDADQIEDLNQDDILFDAGAAPITLEDGNRWISVRSPGNTVGWVNSKFTKRQAEAAGPQRYVVVAPGLNLRADPNPDATIRAVLASGDTLTAAGASPVQLQDGNVWINVRNDADVTGWVNRKFVSAVDGTAAIEKHYVVTAASLNLRAHADPESELVGTLDRGSLLISTANQPETLPDGNVWINVLRPNGPTGWVNRKYTEDISGDPSRARGLQGVEQWHALIQRMGGEVGVPWQVIAAIMGIESGGRPDITSVAGAMGLMQIMPFHFRPGEDPYDPETNVRRGAQILKDNFRRWGTWDQAAAAYFGAINGNGGITTAEDGYGTSGLLYVSLFNSNLIALGWFGSVDTPPASEWLAAALDRAKSAIGGEYVWGGESWEEGGFDCSGLVYWAYNLGGQRVPRTAQEQYDATPRIDRSQLQPGDLVFYTKTYETAHTVTHVAIFVGGTQVLMSSGSRGVTYAALDDPWYGPKVYGFGRVQST